MNRYSQRRLDEMWLRAAYAAAATLALACLMIIAVAFTLRAEERQERQDREPLYKPPVKAHPGEVCWIDLRTLDRRCPDLCSVIPNEWRDHVCGAFPNPIIAKEPTNER